MTCAFTSCAEVKACALVGGCVNDRFQRHEYKPTLPKAKAHNGTKAPKRKAAR